MQSFKKKTVALLIVIAACVAAMAFMLWGIQQNLTFSGYDSEFEQSMEQLPSLLEEADAESDANVVLFDAIYQSKADSVAFMAQNDAGYEETDAKMAELAELLEVNNVLIVDGGGNVLAKAADTKADYSAARFNQIKAVLSGAKAEPMEITLEDQNWNLRYYASQIDSNKMVVIEENPEVLDTLLNGVSGEESVLKDISVGEHGYVFAISGTDYIITYHPNESLIGKDAINEGIDVAGNLQDGNRFTTTIDGQQLYCGVKTIDGNYYIYCVPTSDLAQARVITVGVILFVFFAVMISVALYGVFVMRKDAETQTEEKKDRILSNYGYNETVGKKALILSAVGMIVILGVAFYMQTLFALSSQSITNQERLEQISNTISQNDEFEKQLKDQYKDWYLTKCRTADYIIESNESLATKDKLYELKDVLQIASIYIFDGDGNMTASSTPQKTYSLSNDESDSSYDFRMLLSGRADELVQDLSTDDITGEARQYIGVTTHDESGFADGIVQIAVRPQRLESLLESYKIENVLDSVKVGAEGFAFAVSKADGTIAYAPNSMLVGKAATDAGLTEEQIKDGFSDYITLDGTTYYANCKEINDYYIFVAGTEGELMGERTSLTTTAGIDALICFIIMFVILTFTKISKPEEAEAKVGATAGEDLNDEALESPEDQRNIEVTLDDGRTKRSESAVSRWLRRSFSWDEKSPEQKLSTILKWLGGILAFVIFVAICFQDKLFAKGTVFAYILGGTWEHGWNIFAITAAIMYACAAITVAAIIKWILSLLSQVLGARGETVCRLLSSIVEYGMIFVMLFWCLGVLGVDTTTLLAGAGIITLAISFGAQDLIEDIISGLFIIFEGEFRVGDVIEVDGTTGTVMDVGIRTTKIRDGNDDVLVVRNSNISNVINKTKMNSYAMADIALPIATSLTDVENVLIKELPNVHERVPSIVEGPYYKGVVAIDADSMTIRVLATCKEKDRVTLQRNLLREMQLLLYRNNIGSYDPDYATIHVALEEAEEDEEEKTKLQQQIDQLKADRFASQQEQAAKDLGNNNN